jgi:hypothetical protein
MYFPANVTAIGPLKQPIAPYRSIVNHTPGENKRGHPRFRQLACAMHAKCQIEMCLVHHISMHEIFCENLV